MDYFESKIKSEFTNGTPTNRIVFMELGKVLSTSTLFILTREMAAEVGAMISCAGFPCTPLNPVCGMIQETRLRDHWSKGTQFFEKTTCLSRLVIFINGDFLQKSFDIVDREFQVSRGRSFTWFWPLQYLKILTPF